MNGPIAVHFVPAKAWRPVGPISALKGTAVRYAFYMAIELSGFWTPKVRNAIS